MITSFKKSKASSILIAKLTWRGDIINTDSWTLSITDSAFSELNESGIGTEMNPFELQAKSQIIHSGRLEDIIPT